MGATMFSGGYLFVYFGANYISSGLIAVVFSLIVISVALFERVVFGTPLERRMLLAALLGLCGMALVFWPEVATLSLADATITGVLLVCAGVVMASVGTMAAIKCGRKRLAGRQPERPCDGLGCFDVARGCENAGAADRLFHGNCLSGLTRLFSRVGLGSCIRLLYRAYANDWVCTCRLYFGTISTRRAGGVDRIRRLSMVGFRRSRRRPDSRWQLVGADQNKNTNWGVSNGRSGSSSSERCRCGRIFWRKRKG